MWNKTLKDRKKKVKCSKSLKIFPVSFFVLAAIVTLWIASNIFSCARIYSRHCLWSKIFLAGYLPSLRDISHDYTILSANFKLRFSIGVNSDIYITSNRYLQHEIIASTFLVAVRHCFADCPPFILNRLFRMFVLWVRTCKLTLTLAESSSLLRTKASTSCVWNRSESYIDE
jgi:hypothetical protein